jgi:hypothetical protein
MDLGETEWGGGGLTELVWFRVGRKETAISLETNINT